VVLEGGAHQRQRALVDEARDAVADQLLVVVEQGGDVEEIERVQARLWHAGMIVYASRMRKLLLLVAVALVVGCSRNITAPADPQLADAQAQADEITAAADFGGGQLDACRLLSRGEVEAAIGALSGPPQSPPEDASDTAEGRCVWRGQDGRVLAIAASGEGGSERLGAIQAYAVVGAMGDWEDARLQGCCLLHAEKDESMVSLDFSAAAIDLAQAAKLVDLALPRVHEPLETP
jgi:hypothetical protein